MTFQQSIREFTDAARDHVLGLYRIAIGILFFCHGAATLFGVLGGAMGSPGQPAEFASWPGWWAGLIQFVGGGLVVLGLGTRSAAFISSGSMAYGYFVMHQPEGLLPIENGGDGAALFAWSFALLIVTGPGSWSLSSLVTRREAAPARSA